MKIRLWGTRGSLASPGPDTVRYGGNTSCVSVEGPEGTLLVLDAGTGIRCLGLELPADIRRVNILLTHLHMDHLQGLPFFAPLRRPGVEVHIWGPAGTTSDLGSRVKRYLSPPLFPVSVREISMNLNFHESSGDSFEIDEFAVETRLVLHPNPTIGYRISSGGRSMAYLPDHEPALGAPRYPPPREWTSGFELAEGADVLIHDSQYTDREYEDRIGFGHSSIAHAFQFAGLTGARRFVPFHHDPSHSDDKLDAIISEAVERYKPAFEMVPGKEGLRIEI